MDVVPLQAVGRRIKTRQIRMRYDLFEHRHRFAVWAAARAAQRGLTDVATLQRALEACGVQEFVRSRRNLRSSAQAFERHHRRWCSRIVTFLRRRGIAGATYGRAAKLVAIYLKSMVVLGPDSDSPLGRVIHPPIDRRLLTNLLSMAPKHEHLRRWRQTAWTKLDAEHYYALIADLRKAIPAGQPFWTLEQHWTSA